MAKGEKTFSSKGKQAKKFENKPPPVGDYSMKLRADRAEIRKAKSGRSRVSVAFELLDSNPDGKNFWVFHDFHLGLAPGKDGIAMPERADQLVGFAHGAGTEVNASTVDVTVAPNPDDPDTTVTEEALNAMTILKWIKSLDGTIVKGHVKHEKGSDGVVRGKVAHFEEAEGSSGADEDEDDEDEDEETEAEETDEEGDDEDSDDDEDEDEEPVKKVKKGDKKKSKK